MKFLENNGRYQSATNLLYRRYSVLEEMEQKKSFFINELSTGSDSGAGKSSPDEEEHPAPMPQKMK